MKVKSLVLIMAVSLLLITACSSGSSSSGGHRTVWQPDWYGLQGDPNYIYTYGFDEKVNQNASERAAYANAMQEAAQYVEAHVQSMIKNYVEEAGVEDPQVLALTSSVSRVVANTTFTGTTTSKRQTIILDNGRYKTFLQVSIPKDQVDRNMRNQIRNEEALYNQFKASQAFQELDRVLDRQ